jgi:hypothetical protein
MMEFPRKLERVVDQKLSVGNEADPHAEKKVTHI